ncbi:unknown; predicted coding region [Mycoplasmopsis pulmonis]|uniref:Uncharacterized protein n=1 Tax=Mycoplasmopsis pulmonis (strain UAB CTIP) TaxID=272635 RepID=Q98QW1_MYCPU|nr:unknown; predicted coding region [Mycoplasmopsis pulmonis]
MNLFKIDYLSLSILLNFKKLLFKISYKKQSHFQINTFESWPCLKIIILKIKVLI